NEAGQRKQIRNPADGVLAFLRAEQEQDRAHQRSEQNDRENVILHNSHFVAPPFGGCCAGVSPAATTECHRYSRRDAGATSLTDTRNRKRNPANPPPLRMRTTAPIPIAAGAQDTRAGAQQWQVR